MTERCPDRIDEVFVRERWASASAGEWLESVLAVTNGDCEADEEELGGGSGGSSRGELAAWEVERDCGGCADDCVDFTGCVEDEAEGGATADFALVDALNILGEYIVWDAEAGVAVADVEDCFWEEVSPEVEI